MSRRGVESGHKPWQYLLMRWARFLLLVCGIILTLLYGMLTLLFLFGAVAGDCIPEPGIPARQTTIGIRLRYAFLSSLQQALGRSSMAAGS